MLNGIFKQVPESSCRENQLNTLLINISESARRIRIEINDAPAPATIKQRDHQLGAIARIADNVVAAE